MLTARLGGGIDVPDLKQDQMVADFRTECIYDNGFGKEIGARFRHAPSGFVLDYLQIQSLPQAFIWVNTFPVSDRGEPHALEHLLLGKGTKGQYVAALEDMRLGSSSAYTQQLRTCYHFSTSAGPEGFFELLTAKLDAMLHPTFSDEEIRREVRNMGILRDPADGTMSLEEKGSVYTEMVSSFENPWSNMSMTLNRLVYGESNPLSYVSGGHPPAMRTMVPRHIRDFHSATHHLNNMGMVVSMPSSVAMTECLTRLSEILGHTEPAATVEFHPDDFLKRLPEPHPAPEGTMAESWFPNMNVREPGILLFTWPAHLDIPLEEQMLFDIFLDAFAGGQTSTLHRTLVDPESRQVNFGATGVFGWRSSYPGNPVSLGFSNVDPDLTSLVMMDSIRNIVHTELERIIQLAPGSPELIDFNQRVNAGITQSIRTIQNFLNSPPRFGYRNSGSGWMNTFHQLHQRGGFHRSMVSMEEFDGIRKIADNTENRWGNAVRKWGLLDAQPYAVVAKPNPGLIQEEETDRKKRIDTAIRNLQEQYGLTDTQKSLLRYEEEYAEKTRKIDSQMASVELPEFLDNPPLTLDDPLDFDIGYLSGGGQLIVSRFDYMTSGFAGLALNLNTIPAHLLPMLSALPTFIRQTGVIRNGEPLSYENMSIALQQEILYLNVFFDHNTITDRNELILTGAGSNLAETHQVLEWMETFLTYPDLRTENLPRIRKAINLALNNLRNRTRGAEEGWVNDPADAVINQKNPLYLATGSFLTRTHSYQRLSWQLQECPDDDIGAFSQFCSDLGNWRTLSRETIIDSLTSLRVRLDDPERPLKFSGKLPSDDLSHLASMAVNDLLILLSDIPDASLPQDWVYLCRSIKTDVLKDPAEILADVQLILDMLRNQHLVRGFIVGSTELTRQIGDDMIQLTDAFYRDRHIAAVYPHRPGILSQSSSRLDEHTASNVLGLVNPNMSTGVHIHRTRGVHYTEYDDEELLDFLASNTFSGGGPHSVFMKTWGAGLAYSNGIRSSEITGYLSYYAERCPDLSQTMQFVVDELDQADFESTLVPYTIAQAFRINRAGDRYESRGYDMAADIADGITPDSVRSFRTRILELDTSKDLTTELRSRMKSVNGKVLPGLDTQSAVSPETHYFVIGSPSQLDSFDGYLDNVNDGLRIHRLYPRDFWLPESGK